ncbi:MAG: Gfo/Idh/MocA family protein, partial [Bryobacteraceae bacterium]
MSQISRRSFFQGATLAASASRVVGANDRIRVGLIGLGGRGGAHLRAYSGISDCQITALCDINQAARERAQARLKDAKAKEYVDMRDMFAGKEVDAVSIATPNHWHALATIWACQAGKDVYCEKPASYNIHESWRMVEVARKTGRMVQIGSQGRSTPHKIKAMQLLKEGVIGKVYMAKGLCFKVRKSIGKTPPEPVPAGIDWDKFLGPAPMRPFTRNRYAYNWHWFWDTGNGDIGNQGV